MSLLLTDGGEGASQEEMAPGGRGEEETAPSKEGWRARVESAVLRVERGGPTTERLSPLLGEPIRSASFFLHVRPTLR